MKKKTAEKTYLEANKQQARYPVNIFRALEVAAEERFII